MASVMLAAYPDIFAGGAIIAGLPYGAATNVQEAFQSMFQSPARPADVWGDLVRSASPHRGPWPRVSVWHGGMDTTVVPSNAAEIVKQWTDVHGLPVAPTVRETVDGYPREVWRNAQGEDLMESYAIPGMAHGTPLSVGTADSAVPQEPFCLRSEFLPPFASQNSGAWRTPPLTPRRRTGPPCASARRLPPSTTGR